MELSGWTFDQIDNAPPGRVRRMLLVRTADSIVRAEKIREAGG